MRFPLTILAALALSLMLVVGASAQTAGRDPAPDPRVAELEVDFLTGMIPHHRDAIMMARMALMKATRPELKEMAQREIDAQSAEISKMSAFLRDWYGMEPPAATSMPVEQMRGIDMPMMHGLMPDMMAQMRELEMKSGADFDIEFMSTMSQHHAQAIRMSSVVLEMGHHEDLIHLANQITMDQAEEIRMMDGWLKEWYGLARPIR